MNVTAGTTGGLLSPEAPVLPAWYDDAACLGAESEDFFEGGPATARAKALCKQCPVRELCLQAALENNERYGVWGGLTYEERRPILRRMRAEARRSRP